MAAGRTRARVMVVAALCAGAGVLSLVAGCETTIAVRPKQRPFFAAAGGADDVRSDASGRGASAQPGAAPTPETLSSITQTQPDGSVRLLARTPRHLIVHVYNTLMNDQRQLFATQLLSRITREEFVGRGLDPGEAYDMLRAMEDDVVDLFNAIPFGDATAGARVESVGMRVLRIHAPPERVQRSRLVAIDVVVEEGNWKLRWVVPRGGAGE